MTTVLGAVELFTQCVELAIKLSEGQWPKTRRRSFEIVLWYAEAQVPDKDEAVCVLRAIHCCVSAFVIQSYRFDQHSLLETLGGSGGL